MTNEPTNNENPETLPGNPIEEAQPTKEQGTTEAASMEVQPETGLPEVTPVEEAPAEEAPVVEAPAEAAPVVEAPAEAAPVVEGEAVAEAAEAEAAAAGKGRRRKKMDEAEAQIIWEEIKNAYENKDLLTFHLSRSIPGGGIVSYKGIEGFVPRSQFEVSGRAEQAEIDAMVGQELDLVIIEMTDVARRKFVCSRKRALKRHILMSLVKGSIVEGKVTSITSYGAFVDIGGVDGLIHVSRLSKMRSNVPTDVVKVGEVVKVRIVDINEKEERIALSMKEFTTSPWQSVEENYKVGATVKGKVRNITDFGVYVQLEPGMVGMIHISDLSWTQRLQHPSEMVTVGDDIEVMILEIRAKDRRVSLSLKATQPDPWPRLANVYPANTEADAKIKYIMDAGAIVSLEHDIDCFIPRGKMGGHRRPAGDTSETHNIGDTIRIKIVEMDPDKHSFIGAVPREENEQSSRPQRRGGDRSEPRSDFKMPQQSSSDSAFRLGDLEGLQKLFRANAEAEAAEAAITAPVVEKAPEVAETPVVDEAPAVAETPVVEEAPTVDETPVVEEAPAVDETPVVEEAPAVEETPVVEEAPEVDETPVVEEAPAVEETPVVKEAPAVAETPVVEAAPEVDETPAVDEEAKEDTPPTV
ncbi:MAG: S1 RNA-binding domain-containing protein [Bacteroidota bacterium]